MVATKPPTRRDLDRIVKDIGTLTAGIESRWHRNRAPAGIFGAACRIRQTVDLRALRLCIEWTLDQPPADGVRGYRAAERLGAVLASVARYQRQIEERLRSAA